MGAIETHKVYGIKIRESANDGSDFSNPDTDYRLLFLGEDGQLHVRDSAGTVTDIGTGGGGAVATDTIWDAAGDLAQGTGANTAAKLTLGAAGTVVRSTGATNAYAFPPGYEYDYVQVTSGVSVTATSEATADTLVTGSAITYDGSTVVMVEVYANGVRPDNAGAGNNMSLYLYDGSSSIGIIGFVRTPASGNDEKPLRAIRRLTPSNAAHTYSLRASVNTGTGRMDAGAGGTGNNMPAFIRITKV